VAKTIITHTDEDLTAALEDLAKRIKAIILAEPTPPTDTLAR